MIKDPYRYLTEQHVEGPAERKYLYTLYATYRQGALGFFFVVIFLYYYQMFVLQELTISSFTVLKYIIYILETGHKAITKIFADTNMFDNGFNILLDAYSLKSNPSTFFETTDSFVEKELTLYFSSVEFYIDCVWLYQSTFTFFFEFIKTLLVYESLVSDEENFFFMAPGVIPHYLTSEYINHPDVLDLFKFNNFALLYEQEYLIDAIIRYSLYIPDTTEGMAFHARLSGFTPYSFSNILLHQSAYLSLYKYYLPLFSCLLPENVDNVDSNILLNTAFSSFQDRLKFFIDKVVITYSFYLELALNIFSYNDYCLKNSYPYWIVKTVPNRFFSSTDFYIDSYSMIDYYVEEKSEMVERQAQNMIYTSLEDHYLHMVYIYQSAYAFGWFKYFKGADLFTHLCEYDLSSSMCGNLEHDFNHKIDIMEKLTDVRLDNMTSYLLLSLCQEGVPTAANDYRLIKNSSLTTYLTASTYPSEFSPIKLLDHSWMSRKALSTDVGLLYAVYPLHTGFIDFLLEGQDKFTFGLDPIAFLNEEYNEIFDISSSFLHAYGTELYQQLVVNYKKAFYRDMKLVNEHFPILQDLNFNPNGIILNPKWIDPISFLKLIVRDTWIDKINVTSILSPRYIESNILNDMCFKSIHTSEYIPFLNTNNAIKYFCLKPDQHDFSNSQCFSSFIEFFKGLQDKDFEIIKGISFSKIRTFYDFDFYKILNTVYIISIFFILQKLYRHSIKSIKEILIDYVHYNHTIVFDFIELTLKFLYIKLIFLTLYYLYIFGNTFLVVNQLGSYLN